MGGIGNYTDPERESYCRDILREQMPKYVNSETKSKTMEEFRSLIEEVNKLKDKEESLITGFEKSTCEFSDIFHWIIKCALEGRNSCSLTIDTCPTLYAKSLENMGFEIKENRNCFEALCGYTIYWE